MLVDLSEQKESVEARHDGMLVSHQDLNIQISDLERNLSKVAEQHSKTLESHGSLEMQLAEMRQNHATEFDKCKQELAAEKKTTGRSF